MRYLHEVSKEEASYWRKDTAKRHMANKYTFPSMQWPIKEDWNHLERMHPYVLELSYADGASQPKDTWRKAMRSICTVSGMEPLTPVHEKISMLHEEGGITLPPRTTLTSIVMPSTRLLDSLDKSRSMSLDDLREVIRPKRHLFEDMLANPIQFETDHPDMTIEEMVDLYESFYMVEPIEEKWGRYGSFKCMCENFMSAAICGHSLLLAMLYDKTLTFPPKHSSKQLERRSRQARRPNAWAPEDEDDEDEGTSPKMQWCPVTACDDMEILPAKKQKVVSL